MVDGPDGPHRLPAAGDGAGPPADGAPWAAAFAWLEAPVAFDHARLELGPALAVELPRARPRRFRQVAARLDG